MSSWVRLFYYEEQSQLEPAFFGNRLTKTVVKNVEGRIAYDTDAGKHGCITSMPGFTRMSWNTNDELQSISTQLVNSGIPELTWYTYDSDGHRSRKVAERAAPNRSLTTKAKETIYLSGLEIQRTYAGDGVTVKKTRYISEVMGTSRVAFVEYEDAQGASSPTPTKALIRYPVSPELELDEQGALISYEEYTPFGVSTYLCCRSDISAPSKYRWAAYERDSESCFFYCHRRYYAPWLGQWLSSDPVFTEGGLNTYAYAGNDPVNFRDAGGTWPTLHDDPFAGQPPDMPKPLKKNSITEQRHSLPGLEVLAKPLGEYASKARWKGMHPLIPQSLNSLAGGLVHVQYEISRARQNELYRLGNRGPHGQALKKSLENSTFGGLIHSAADKTVDILLAEIPLRAVKTITPVNASAHLGGWHGVLAAGAGAILQHGISNQRKDAYGPAAGDDIIDALSSAIDGRKALKTISHLPTEGSNAYKAYDMGSLGTNAMVEDTKTSWEQKQKRMEANQNDRNGTDVRKGKP
jgi:RHS repeat-associated protein